LIPNDRQPLYANRIEIRAKGGSCVMSAATTRGPRTLFQKIWDEHVIADLGDGFSLLQVDRHVVHDMGGRSFLGLKNRGLALRHPELTFATADHAIPTAPDVDWSTYSNPYLENLREGVKRNGFKFFEPGKPGSGVVHVVTPEQGIALPGCTLACGDSHTCTVGALGVMAWGVGQSELLHILATQTSVQQQAKTMRIVIDGSLSPAVTAKDVILHIIRKVGASGARGCAVEFAGSAIAAMPMEGRFTICNMATEMGARFGLIAPDDITFAYLEGRPYAPRGELWQQALSQWRKLRSDEGAPFDRELAFNIGDIPPQISWGTSPDHVIGIDENVPDPQNETDPGKRKQMIDALGYIGIEAGLSLNGTPIDNVFIGSCTNARISDLRAAAAIARGRRVAPHVEAWIVPGSFDVKAQAEREGLDRIFIEAGFQWRNAGCSMCGGMGDLSREKVAPGKRIVSTTNRSFVGRQGPGSRTHLASPAMAAAAAIAGCIVDVRELGAMA
jgi:3-isopropylmalate/(R)-2-methylmalate dehydratase large subunit